MQKKYIVGRADELMSSDPRQIGRFELDQMLDDADGLRFHRGIDSATGEGVVVESIASTDPRASTLVSAARQTDRSHLTPRARLLDAGTDGGYAYAAYRTPAAARSLSDRLDEHSGRSLTLEQRLGILRAIVDLVRQSILAGVGPLAVSPDTIWITPALEVDIIGVVPDAAPASARNDRRVMEGRRLIDVYGALIAGVLLPGGAATGPRLDPEAEERIAALAFHFPAGDDPPLDLDRFATAIAAAMASLHPDGAAAPFDPTGAVLVPAPAMPPGPAKDERSLVYDENVQFTVYRPRVLTPGKWQTLVAFAHLAERRPDAAEDEPDPLSEVARQAKQALGDVDAYRPSTEDSTHAIPRDGELSFIPTAPGVEFNPSSASFRWVESVHRAEFRLRAAADVPPTVRGRMSVYLGALLLAEINMTFSVSAAATAATATNSARPYRKIFASYSHKDQPIVEQYREFAKGLGDRYLQDVYDLRSGEQWLPALEQLIRDADVFQLFWSWHALESPYVQHEWRFALGLNRPSFVRPVYWDDPLPSRGDLPPQELTKLQFARIAVNAQAPPPLKPAPAPLPAPPAPPAPVAAPTPRSAPPQPSPGGTGSAPTSRPPHMIPKERLPPSDNVTLSADTPKRRLSWPLLSAAAGVLVAVALAPMFLRTATPPAAPPDGVGGNPAPVVVSPVFEIEIANTPAGVQVPAGFILQLIEPGTGRVVARAPVDASGVARFSSVPDGRYLVEIPGSQPDAAARPEVSVSRATPGRAVITIPSP